jgi:hypothetical protein
MHEEQEKASRARNILAACGIEVGTDFRALSTSQIDALLAYAEQHRLNKYGPTSKYRMPLSPNLESFYDLVQRRAMYRLRPGSSISEKTAERSATVRQRGRRGLEGANSKAAARPAR